MSPRECQEPAGPQGSRLRETSWTLRLNEHAWKGWRRVCLGNLVEVPGSRRGGVRRKRLWAEAGEDLLDKAEG